MHIHIYIYIHLPANPVARIVGRPASSNPRSFTKDRCEGVSRWPMRPPGADSSAEVGLQRPASMSPARGRSTSMCASGTSGT